MAAGVETLFGQGKMTLWRRCDVNHLRCGRSQQLANIRKALFNPKTFRQLLGHEQFAIADRYDFAIRDAANGVHMIIGNIAATDERDPQGARSCSLRTHNLVIKRLMTDDG